MHFESRDGQVWVQQNFTNHGIANDLAGASIPKERIVLGYKSASERSDVLYDVARTR